MIINKTIMRKNVVLATLGILCFFANNQCQFTEEARTQATYERYCGACHLTPDPSALSKDLWTKRLLPEMGARLGIRQNGYDPYKDLVMEEVFHIDQKQIYPKEPLISVSDWDKVCQYILSRAPDSLAVDLTRKDRSQQLERFQAKKLKVDNLRGSMVTAIHFNELEKNWWIGNRSGEWYQLTKDSTKLVYLFASALSGFSTFSSKRQVLEMGFMHPSDVPKGMLWEFDGDKRTVIADQLFRPVNVSSLDLDKDRVPEYVVCEFGNRIGRLSIFRRKGRKYQQTALLQISGTIKVKASDLNKDKLEDLVVLAGQGDEGIYIFYNQGDGKFSINQAIRLPSVYGSSSFDLFDYEGDGDMDIAIVNGDNADYTYALKPYHGFRLFLNDGMDRFREAFFFPVYGATQVLARDFDQDGDVDFAVTAVFPDFENNPEESFVYLENEEAETFQFRSYTTPAAIEGNWLVMEAGDFEQDGDLDILLGSFTQSPARVPAPLLRRWATQNTDLLLLENQTVSPAGIQSPSGDH